MKRKLRKLAGYAGIVLVLLGIVAYLARDPLRDALAQVLSRRMSKSLHASLRIGTLRGSLWGSLVLRDVVLRDAQGVVAQVDEVRLVYHPLTLLTGRLIVSLVDIVRPRLSLVQEADGRWNVSRLLPSAASPPAPEPSSSAGGLPVALLLARVQVREGHLGLQTAALPGVQAVDAIQIRLRGRIDRRDLQVEIQRFTARATPAEVAIRTLQGVVRGLPGNLRVDDLRLQTGNSSITVRGVVPGGSRTASLAIRLQPLDMAEIGRLLQNDTLRGLVVLSLNADGPPPALHIRARLDTSGGRADLQSRINMTAAPVQYRGLLRVSHLDLATLLGRPAWQSDLNLQLRVDGQGLVPHDLRGQIDLEIQPSHVGTVVLRPSQLQIAAQPHRFVVKRGNIDTSVARLTATGVVDLQGTSDLHYTLLADLAHLRQLLGTETLEGKIEARGRLRGEPADLRGGGMVHVRNLRYQQNRLADLRLTYEARDLGRQPQITADLELRRVRVGTLPIRQVRLQAAYHGSERRLRFVTEVHQSPAHGGTARGSVTFADAGQHLRVEEMQVRLAHRVWTAQVPLELEFAPGRVWLKPFRLVQARQTLAVSGALEGQRLRDFRLQADNIDLAMLHQLVALPPQINGRASLRVGLLGTLTEPVLHSVLTWQAEMPTPSTPHRVRISLDYRDRRLRSDLRLRQGTHEALRLHLTAPVNLALTAVPLERRLVAAAATLQAEIRGLDLQALRPVASMIPDLTGTLQGSVAVRGTYTALDLDTRLRLQGVGMPGPVDRVSGPLRLTARLVTATSLPMLIAALRQGNLRPQVHDLELRIPSLRGVLRADAGVSRPWRLDHVRLRAEGALGSTGWQATLKQLRFRAEGVGMPSVRLDMAGRVTPQYLELSRFRARLPRSQIRLHGTLARASQELRFRLDLPGLWLDEFAAALPPAFPREVRGVVQLRGTIRAPEVDAQLQYAGADITTRVTAQFRRTIPRYTLTLRLNRLHTTRLFAAVPGTLDMRLRLQGVGFAPEQRQARLAVRIDSEDFSLAPGLTTELRARLAGNTLYLEQLRLQSAPISVEASGRFSTVHDLALEYAVRLGDLHAWRRILGPDLQASGRISGTVSGRRKALQSRGEIRLDSWRLAGLQGTDLRADFEVANLLTAPRATLRAELKARYGAFYPPSSMRVDGEYQAPGGRFKVAVTSGPYANTVLAGAVRLQDGQRLRLHQLRLQGRGLIWENVEPVEVVRDTQGTLQLVRFRLRNGEQEISVRGRLTAARAVAATARIRKFRIRPAIRAFAPGTAVPQGELAADLDLSGDLRHPRLSGSLKLSALQWRQQALGELRLRLDTVDARLRTDLRWQDQGRELFRIQGTLGLTPEAALALEVRSPSFDLARLQSLHPALRHSAGRLEVDLRLEGSLRRPQVQGSVVLRHGELQLAATGEPYQDIQAQLVFAGDRVEIKRFDIGSRSGPLQLRGWIETSGLALRQLDLSLQADTFTAVHRPELEAVVSAAIRARGSLEDLALSGKITLPRARLRLQGKLGGGPADVAAWELTVPGVYGPGRQALDGRDRDGRQLRQPVLFPFLRADVTLDIPNNAWLQGSGMAVELRGKMRVRKQLHEPFEFDGAIETVRGFASVYGKKFTLQEGKVTFPGTSEINPFLDITVTHKVSDYVVTVQVGGKAQTPKLTLSSEPGLEQADIVSLLVIGKTTDRLTISEQQLLSDRGGQVLGGVAAGQLQNMLGEAFGLDMVEVEAGDKLGTGRVGVGRYVTQDIFLSYEREVGGKGGNTVGIEYSINRRLKLKGSTSDVGETAVDLFWRLDY